MRAQRATPRIGGKAIERKTGLPQRPKMKPGGDVVRLLGCWTSEDMERPRTRHDAGLCAELSCVSRRKPGPKGPKSQRLVLAPGSRLSLSLGRDTSRSLLRRLPHRAPSGIEDQHIAHRAMQRCW